MPSKAAPRRPRKQAKAPRPPRRKKTPPPKPGFRHLLAGAALLAALALSFYLVWNLLGHGPGSPSTVAASAASVGSARIAVDQSPADMGGLPFEENLASPIEDGVKQVDFALLQAISHAGLSSRDLHLEAVELRRQGDEAYHFQSVQLAIADPAAFASHLDAALAAWGVKARVDRSRQGIWRVSVNGVLTHELRLPRVQAPPVEEIRPPDRLAGRPQSTEPRLVIVMDDLGQSRPAARRLLALSYPVTFAVWPGSSHARGTAEAAHSAGREVIIHQPMEPLGYPSVKPGPSPLLLSTSEQDIRRILANSVSRVPHAVGLNNHMGSRFTTQAADGLRVLVGEASSRGLFLLDSMTHPASLLHKEAARQGVPCLKRDVFLDVTAERGEILRQLRKAERVALLTGSAVAIGHPLPETLSALEEWQTARNPAVKLVRLSDLLSVE